VTVSAVDDDEDHGFSSSYSLLTSVSSFDSMSICESAGRSNCAVAALYSTVLAASFTVTVIDDDISGVFVSVTTNATFDNFGNPLQFATYSLCLTSRPLTAVTITLSGLGDWSTSSKSQVTFAPDAWNKPVTVSVSAVCIHFEICG